MKKLVLMSLVVLVAVFLAAPSAMAKKVLTEDELDLITAAGQPVIVTGGTGSIVFTDSSDFSFDLPAGAQTAVQALVVNNVVGEMQLANAFNIESMASISGGDQKNIINQSWGSTKDLSFGFASVAGVTATASASAPATIAIEPACSTVFGSVKCGIVKSTAGNATAAAAAAASTSAGKLAVAVLSEYADVIIDNTGGTDTFVDINPIFSMDLGSTSQATLSALFINNLAGMSQVANALNLASGAVMQAGQFINSTAGSGVVSSQVNVINQYRGTPKDRPDIPAILH